MFICAIGHEDGLSKHVTQISHTLGGPESTVEVKSRGAGGRGHHQERCGEKGDKNRLRQSADREACHGRSFRYRQRGTTDPRQPRGDKWMETRSISAWCA